MTEPFVQKLASELAEMDALDQANRWLARGDGIAVYENQDLGHPEVGHRQYVSYGGPEAQLEGEVPPVRLPDFRNKINWRYTLVGVYRGKPLESA